MLFTLKAPRAYLPLRAFANSSLVCVNGINRFGTRCFALSDTEHRKPDRECKAKKQICVMQI
jgi:hypothetical protein